MDRIYRINFLSHLRSTAFTVGGFFLLFILLVANSAGQAPVQTPPSQPDEVLRINTELIQTDVTVVDKEGRFVDGLRREQFELRVDGKPQPLAFFGRISAGVGETVRKSVVDNTASSPKSTANTAARGRTIIFFVDDLHLSLSSLTRTRESLLSFINDKMMINDQVAVASGSGQIGFLQQFTNNKDVLRAAVARLQYKAYSVLDTEQPPMSEYMALRIEDRDRNAMGYYVERCVKENLYPPYKCVQFLRNRAREILSRAAVATDNTFSSLESLMRTITAISGRKVILLMSDGFYLSARDRNTNSNEALQRITDTARRSGSVIYTIDARGLVGQTGQADASASFVDFNGLLDKANLGEIALSQDGLNALARETGGRALRNSFDMTNWINESLAETSNYYLLAWQPEKEETSNKFKRIEVSVAGRPDLTVRLQRGYLANRKDAADKKDVSKKTGTEKNSADLKTKDSPAKTLLPISLSLSYLDVPGKGAVLTSSVQVATDSLNYSDEKPAAIDMAGVVFNEQGKQVASFKTGLSVTKSAASEAGASEQSVIYNNRTPLAAGLYQVRVAARETGSGQAGNVVEWIEIPDLTKQKLTLSSLLLDAQAVKKAQPVNDENVQAQFSVDHRFASPLNLNFLAFIYNAARAGGGEVNLTTQISVFDAQGRAVINSPARPLIFKGTNDAARIPLKGSIRQDLMTPGIYLLQINVSDLIAGTSAVRQTIFTVE
jgi:VWFA-related protein